MIQLNLDLEEQSSTQTYVSRTCTHINTRPAARSKYDFVDLTTFIIPTGQGHINKIFTKATLVFAYGLIKKGKNKKNPEVNVYL